MSARQLIVLAFAAVAAVLALVVIRGMGSRSAEPTTQASASIAGEQVLVVARDVPQGAALTPSDLAVATFPEGSVTPAFIRISQMPSAQTDFVGAVTRRAFAQGEPIVLNSVLQPDGHGFMAALLEPGYRAVAVEIAPEAAAGGFIQPNDRVDVIVTHEVQGEEGGEQIRSEIVLQDVRVLAIGDQTQTQTSGEAPAVLNAATTVLELTAEDARVLQMGREMGEVSLALRGVQAETVGLGQSGRGVTQQSGAVRIHAFGSVSGGGR